MNRLELLAPAGDMDALIAAVQNGADAVYLGAGGFNARRNANNFDGDGLKRAVDYCHARNVHVHVTLNTLVRQDELDALFDTVRQICESGADAAIVQDFGVARAVRRMAPGMELHASTQMAAHNAHATRFLKDQGFDRAVLARECTFEEMAQCVRTGIDVEVFVHGALCVACSGQCLMSSLVGGRSGNRGLCAQPCRLPWRLDGHEGYLLSTRDLCAIDDLLRLMEIGVKSLKIEGRMKRAEYVAVTVDAYRRALDALYEGAAMDTRQAREDLRQMFNRGGFTRGYGPGLREDALMFPERPNHIGVPVGACARPGRVALKADVQAADALALRGRGEDVPVKLAGAAGEEIACPGARRGDRLVRLVSEAQMRAARASFDGERRRIPVTGRAVLKVGEPACLAVSDGTHDITVHGDIIRPATGRPFDAGRAREQLSKTGGTPYLLEAIEIDAGADAFVPASMLNALRREALDRLTAARTAVNRAVQKPPSLREAARSAGGRQRPQSPSAPVPSEREPFGGLLYVQSGDPEVLGKALKSGGDVAVYCPEDLRNLSADGLPERFALALPAVLTGAALDALNAWANQNADRIAETFLSNVAQLGLEWPGRLTGDFMLNAANDLTVMQLMDWGIETVTPSVELTARQIDRMGGAKNLIVWGRIPLMHLRHCPLRAAKGMKGLHAECRSCDVCGPGEALNGRSLIDRRGAAFPLNRVAMPGGCVIQVLNSVPLMPLKRRDRLPESGGWRLLLRPDEPVEAVVRVYRAALDGADFRSLPEWEILEKLDATTGHFFRGVE